MQNAAYSDKIGLRGVKEDQYFAFQHGTTYRCAIVVARKKSELYVDGKLICTGPGREKKTDKIMLTAGDGWSPGLMEYEDFIILRGTEKPPAL